MLRHALALALFASTSAVSRLKWVGDYQTGDWGTDAAESLAYDAVEKRAFIASAAGSGSVNVVDVTDPVNMQEISTILAGPTASQSCEQQSCFYENLDFGGGSSPCGYAPVIGMVFDKGDCSACNRSAVADAATQTGSGAATGVCDPGNCPYTSIPTTNSGDMSVDARAASPEGCKAICQETDGCEFYSWENQWWAQGDTTMAYGPVDATIGAYRVNKCFLKGGYPSATRESAGLLSTTDCESYVHWEAHKVQSPRGAICENMGQTVCENPDSPIAAYNPTWVVSTGSGVQTSLCVHNGARGSDDACLASNGRPTSADWEAGAVAFPYGFAPGAHRSHATDGQWRGGSGPANCGTFRAGGVQSVAITKVPNYPDSVVAVAMTHHYKFADGALAFFNSRTLEFLACGAAGKQPESLAVDNNGTISCMNEGSAMNVSETPIDTAGSMTLCSATSDSTVTTGLSVACNTYPMEKSTFATGAWKHAAQFRNDSVRLYGPNGNNVTLDLEPEGGTFTDDGKYLLVVMQDNDAYAMWDVEAGKYLFMKGFGVGKSEGDMSDLENGININNAWGAPPPPPPRRRSTTPPPDVRIPANKTRMPDQVTSFMVGDKYYFITANEGGSRDNGEGLLGASGDFEGEEVHMGKLSCSDTQDACDDEQLGRALTTGYMPSNYAINACGNNLCGADGMAAGMDVDSTAGFMPGIKGRGRHRCVYKDVDYGGCGSVCNPVTEHSDWSSNTATCSSYPQTVAHYVNDVSDNAYYGAGCTAPNCNTQGFRFASFAAGCSNPAGCTGVRILLNEQADSMNPLGYDAAVECQNLCNQEAMCDYFYSEYEMGKFECFLKHKYGYVDADTCNELSFKDDHYAYSTPFPAGTPGAKPYVSEGTASWGGPKSGLCEPSKYSNVNLTVPAGPGSDGGSITVGGRSFTIWSWSANETELTEVFDSGGKMEEVQSNVSGGLCSNCYGYMGPGGGGNYANVTNLNGDACATHCPFNSGVAPPMMDDRSDDMGPEPECVTTGVMPDGTRLAFIGLERTGGIIVYDVTDPAAPVYNDFLNVRNWMSDAHDRWAVGNSTEVGTLGALYKQKALNDGPEALAFIDAATSPIASTPMLLAVSPLSGRLSAYEIVESSALRTNDGSCPSTAGCDYLPTTVGGTGLLVSNKKVGGLSTYDPTAYTVPVPVFAVIGFFGAVIVIGLLVCMRMYRGEKKGKPVIKQFDPVAYQEKQDKIAAAKAEKAAAATAKKEEKAKAAEAKKAEKAAKKAAQDPEKGDTPDAKQAV